MRPELPTRVVAIAFAVPCSITDSPQAWINKVIISFQSSLGNYDTKALDQLLLADSNAWANTVGDDTLKAMRNKHPTAPYDSGGACKSFLDSLGSTSSHTEQDFYDVHINADGSVVSVYFLPDVGAHQLARDAA
jgi:hypothetical protein